LVLGKIFSSYLSLLITFSVIVTIFVVFQAPWQLSLAVTMWIGSFFGGGDSKSALGSTG